MNQLNLEDNIQKNALDLIDNISREQLVSMIKSHPCVRGMISGYISEMKFKEFLAQYEDVSDCFKPKDHDRVLNKADLIFCYGNNSISVQIKSIQTRSVKWKNNKYIGNIQNDASDKRNIILPNNEQITTTNYQIGEYDILAVPLFLFTNEWTFAYKLNKHCRKSTSKKYSRSQRQYLLSTIEKISYPLDTDWTTDIITLLETHWPKENTTLDLNANNFSINETSHNT